MNVWSLSPAQLASLTAIVWPLLRKGCVGGGADPAQMLDAGMTGKAVFWLAMGDEPLGLIVTEVNEWPEGRVLRILCLAGERMKAWLPEWHRVAREHARANECVKIVTEGRRGWERVLGMKPVRYVYELEIDA